jgi:hypothetical protein
VEAEDPSGREPTVGEHGEQPLTEEMRGEKQRREGGWRVVERKGVDWGMAGGGAREE